MFSAINTAPSGKLYKLYQGSRACVIAPAMSLLNFGSGPLTIEGLYTVLHDEMSVMIGTFIGVFLSGILVALGASVWLLSSKKKPLSRQDYFLRLYTIILIFFVVAFEVQSFILGNAPIMTLFRPRSQLVKLGTALIVLFNISLVIVVGLTDGLMVRVSPSITRSVP